MPEQINCDVLVCGAGSAGIAAAVNASEHGMKTVLIERQNFPGGKATAAEVRTLCGFYQWNTDTPELMHKGFPASFIQQLRNQGNYEVASFDQGLYFLPYRPFDFKQVAENFLKNAGVNIFYHSYPLQVFLNERGVIDSVEVLNKDRVIQIQPKYLIDASGEAVFAALCNLPQLKEDLYQTATQVFTVQGIALENNTLLNLLVNKFILKAVKEGKIDPSFDRLSLVPASFKDGKATFKLSLVEATKDQMNIHSDLEVLSRKRVTKLFEFLKEDVDGFQKSEIASIAPELGIRTGRRYRGKYILNEKDVLDSARFEHAIARGSWPIEEWGKEKRVALTYPQKGSFYEIPLSCLQSEKVENLLFAGRNISADAKAIASVRVIGICMATGSAAGIYAAEKIKGQSDQQALNCITKELLIHL